MNPVLIFKDTEQIEIEKALLVNAVSAYQRIYNAFKAINIAVTLADINKLAYPNGVAGFEREFVVSKLLDAAEPFEINGLKLTRQAFSTMLAVPDVSDIKRALKDAEVLFSDHANSAKLNLLTLVDDVVSKVQNSDEQIEASYTEYAKTPESGELYKKLQLIADAMNSFDIAYNGVIYKGLSNHQKRYIGAPFGAFSVQNNTAVMGIDVRNQRFVVSLKYIRQFEAGYGTDQ